jgi:SpoVK/Ycf46/Vps4 family AAA+-type ATPase
MAKADQIKSLIKSHFEGQNERFITIALQIAAHEVKIGHVKLANEIKNLIDKKRKEQPSLKPLNGNIQGLVLEYETADKLTDLIVSAKITERIKRIVNEFIQIDKLRKNNYTNRRKLLLTGPPGTGKTMTASVISNELSLPLYIILVDKMVTKYMGETSAKLRQIFEEISNRRGVFLFDEFDAIGTHRGVENDVGEMRRVLNSFLQFIERDDSESIIIAATNNLQLLDKALFRRFDDVLRYDLPSDEEKKLLIKNRLSSFKNKIDYAEISRISEGLSHSDISQACVDAVKESILQNKKLITTNNLKKHIDEKKLAYHK